MLEGEISEINLIERLVELWREQFTGAIRFESDGIIKIIYFKGGDVLSASTNDRADSIDEILMKAGKVSREHVKQALARRKESETLGDAMLNLGYITRKELTWARRVQVVGVIRSIAAWTTGSFTIVADYLPKRDEGTLFPLPQILVELIVTEQDRQKFDRALSGGSAVLEKAPDFAEVFGRLGLNEDAEAIMAEVDGTKTASEVASASGRDAFNVYKLLQALATLGILTAKPQVTPEFSLDDDFSAAGVADASDMWAEPPASEPEFQFDEAATAGPTLEVPSMNFDLDETKSLPQQPVQTRSAWDDADEEPVVAPAAPMPAWDTPPAPIAAPIPVPIEPPADATEEQWGFDEAQIEAARRGTEPGVAAKKEPLKVAAPMHRGKVKEGGKRTGLVVAMLAIVLLAGAAYGIFWWWQKQQTRPAESVAVTRPKPTPPVTTTAPPAQTATIVEAPVTATATGATTTTQEPAPAPMTITPATPPPVTTTTTAAVEALPVVKPRTASTATGRARYDEMARQFAATPQGKFAVQIQILCDPSNLEKAMRAGGDNVWFVPQPLGERSCYRLYWGRYDTRAEAQRALANVPASLRDQSSAVKALTR
ncbi:MAG TPA: DUF4388 domain-containing protein [Thermoanaerobaculia bacterium]|jgi:hypothetical protein